jgi:hypothetical protein
VGDVDVVAAAGEGVAAGASGFADVEDSPDSDDGLEPPFGVAVLAALRLSFL